MKVTALDAIKFGWATFKKYPGLLVGITLIYALAQYIPSFLVNLTGGSAEGPNFLLVILFVIFGMVLQIILNMGAIKVSLDLVDGKKPEISDLFSYYNQFNKLVHFFLATLISRILVFLAMLPFIIVGIILIISIYSSINTALTTGETMSPLIVIIIMILALAAIAVNIFISLGFMFYSFLIVDKNAKFDESLKRSWNLVKGKRWQLLGFAALLVLVVLLGAVALLVGLLVALPVASVAMAYVYRNLER